MFVAIRRPEGTAADPRRRGAAQDAVRETFLKGCGTSHGGARISGSMISILEGKLPRDCDRASFNALVDGDYHRAWVDSDSGPSPPVAKR